MIMTELYSQYSMVHEHLLNIILNLIKSIMCEVISFYITLVFLVCNFWLYEMVIHILHFKIC